MVTVAAHAGDEVAREAFAQLGQWLGMGLADMTQILDPQVLVVGGGVVDAGDLLLEPTRVAYHHALCQRDRSPVAPVLAAQLGNPAGMIGAADLARLR
jgi:glucokinase